MPYVASYSNVTRATVDDAVWKETWTFLASWRGYLQSIPGFLTASIGARRLSDDRVRVHTVTTWEDLALLEDWLSSEWTAAKRFARLSIPAVDVDEEIIEDYA